MERHARRVVERAQAVQGEYDGFTIKVGDHAAFLEGSELETLCSAAADDDFALVQLLELTLQSDEVAFLDMLGAPERVATVLLNQLGLGACLAYSATACCTWLLRTLWAHGLWNDFEHAFALFAEKDRYIWESCLNNDAELAVLLVIMYEGKYTPRMLLQKCIQHGWMQWYDTFIALGGTFKTDDLYSRPFPDLKTLMAVLNHGLMTVLEKEGTPDDMAFLAHCLFTLANTKA